MSMALLHILVRLVEEPKGRRVLGSESIKWNFSKFLIDREESGPAMGLDGQT